jgi:hypothetical protein
VDVPLSSRFLRWFPQFRRPGAFYAAVGIFPFVGNMWERSNVFLIRVRRIVYAAMIVFGKLVYHKARYEFPEHSLVNDASMGGMSFSLVDASTRKYQCFDGRHELWSNVGNIFPNRAVSILAVVRPKNREKQSVSNRDFFACFARFLAKQGKNNWGSW